MKTKLMDVLAAMAAARDELMGGQAYATMNDMTASIDTVRELIEADTEYDAAADAVYSCPQPIGANKRFADACKRRIAALARCKGESA